MIEQAMIVVFGSSAIWLANHQRESMRRWGCICGLLGQPAWFIATIKAHQHGMIFACVLYTASWLNGLNTYWIRWRVR